MSRDSAGKKEKEFLPAPAEVSASFPIGNSEADFIEDARNQLRLILDGEDDRKVIITGPCSVHDLDAALEYAERLKGLSARVSDQLLLIMRLYFEKPRTTIGWKGFCYDPFLDGSHAVSEGICLTRGLLANVAKLGLPAAAEFLSPLLAPYFSELITWGCIGSRTAESQTHREMASSMPMPIAFKNNTEGNVNIAIRGMISAASPHTFLSIDENGKTYVKESCGNSHCHLVLRGGDKGSNYCNATVASATDAMSQTKMTPAIIVDCSHDNSRRNYKLQPMVFEDVISQIISGESAIKGMILESNLHSGKQSLGTKGSRLEYGISITDCCLDWEATEALILEAAEALRLKTSPKRSEQHAQSLASYT